MANFEGRRDMSHNQYQNYETVIENLGPLYGPNKEFKDAYTGSIGLATEQDRLALEMLCREDLGQFYEDTQPGAPEDCGDERPATTFVEAAMKEVGPQAMGGTSTNALVWGLVTGRGGNHLSVIRDTSSAYTHNGVEYRPGGHTAEGAHEPNCGCAAIDLIPGVVGVIADPARRHALVDITARLMGPENFEEEAFNRNILRYMELNRRLDTYLPEGYQQGAIDLMRRLSPDIDPINTRVGEHKGLAVVANHVKGTRLSQDLLYSVPNELNRRFEAFGVDVWHAYDLSEKLFPHGSRAGAEFTAGRLMYDGASLLAITDGSIVLLQHKPR
jgi:hypothetical protein